MEGHQGVAQAVMATEAREARRGFVFITGAKIWFLLAATLLNIGLPRILGDPALFGDYGVVNTLISILNMVMVTGVIQAVSKRVSERPELAGAIRVASMRLQAGLGGVIFLALLFGADRLARDVLSDASLAPLIRIGAVVTLAYAFYGALIGVINGLKRFAVQAAFDVGYATVKVGLIIGLVVLGYGVSGAFAGFAAAATLVAIVAAVYVRRLCPAQPGHGADFALLSFMLPVMGYVLFMNVLLQADVLVVKAAAWEPVRIAIDQGEAGWIELLRAAHPEAEGETLIAAGTSFLSGVFKATKNISLVPYQGVVAITFVVFPLISRATFEEDAQATSLYVTQSLRVTLLLVALIVTGIAAGGAPLLGLLFGDAYRLATGALMPLLVAMALFSALYVVASVLTAAGKPRDALVLMAVMSIVLLVTLYQVVSSSPAGAELLERAAWSVLAVTAIAWLAASALVRWRLGVSMPWSTLARVTAAGALGVACAAQIGEEGFLLLGVRCALAGVVFLALLVVTGELGKRDLNILRATLQRGSS
jgi:O-antigen/teichoic acid export membrane protein